MFKEITSYEHGMERSASLVTLCGLLSSFRDGIFQQVSTEGERVATGSSIRPLIILVRMPGDSTASEVMLLQLRQV